MFLDEREKIRRFVLGLRHPIHQFVKLQMESYPSFTAVMDMAKLMEMDEKDDNDDKMRKRKHEQEGKPLSHGGTSRVSSPEDEGNQPTQNLWGEPCHRLV